MKKKHPCEIMAVFTGAQSAPDVLPEALALMSAPRVAPRSLTCLGVRAGSDECASSGSQKPHPPRRACMQVWLCTLPAAGREGRWIWQRRVAGCDHDRLKVGACGATTPTPGRAARSTPSLPSGHAAPPPSQLRLPPDCALEGMEA